jgi:hypothetical protein
MIKYEQLWERQWECSACYGAPPTESTDFTCPGCGRIVTKEVSEEYWARTTQKDHIARMMEFYKRMGSLTTFMVLPVISPLIRTENRIPIVELAQKQMENGNEPTMENRMPNHKDGDPYINDTRLVEYFHKFDSSVGTMGGWGYDEKLLIQHAKVIARYVFDWSLGENYHPHDSCGNCRNLKDVEAMHRDYGALFNELLDYCGNFTLTKEYLELPKTDPLSKDWRVSGHVKKVTINGYEGWSANEFGEALWHAVLKWALAEQAKENNEII